MPGAPLRLRAALVAPLLICCGVPRVVRALDEGRWQAGVTPAIVVNTNGRQVFAAAGLRLDGRYALTDTFSVGGAIGTILAPGPEGLAHADSLAAGMTLAFPLSRWVPFGQVGVTAMTLAGNGAPGSHLGPEVSAGAERLISATWSLVLVGRLQYFPVQLSGRKNDPGAMITFGLGVARSF
jgi:hypothetical protein